MCPWTINSVREHSIFFAHDSWKSARENAQKSARERDHLPVNFRKKVPVKIFQNTWFTGTFDVREKKKNTACPYIIYL